MKFGCQIVIKGNLKNGQIIFVLISVETSLLIGYFISNRKAYGNCERGMMFQYQEAKGRQYDKHQLYRQVTLLSGIGGT